MSLPPVVENVVGTYLAAVDAEAPGLVEGLYLTGSVALGDFRPRASDIDFVAVTAQPLDATATAAVGQAHVTWHTLARHDVTCRGPDREQLKVWTNAGALAAWTRAPCEVCSIANRCIDRRSPVVATFWRSATW